MSVMFLLNPPKRKLRMKRNRSEIKRTKLKLPKLGYPSRMGPSAKRTPRPSHTYGGSRIFKYVKDELGLKTGEYPIKHRITLYRHPKHKTAIIRSPLAAIRNRPKHKVKEVKSNMARRRRKHNPRRHVRRHHAKRTKVLVVNRPRRRRHYKHNPVKSHRRVIRHRRYHRRNPLALAALNPRRHIKRYHRRSRGFLTNPLGKLGGGVKGMLKPLAKAGGFFAGYAASRVVSNYLWKYVGPYLKGKDGKDYIPEKWAKPALTAISAIGLSYITRKFIFKKKPEIADYILIGGLFSVVIDVVNNLKGTKLAGYKEIDNALSGYTVEPAGSLYDYTQEPMAGYAEDELEPEPEPALSDTEEPERFTPLY